MVTGTAGYISIYMHRRIVSITSLVTVLWFAGRFDNSNTNEVDAIHK